MKGILRFLTIVLSVLLLDGCNHKELCMEHPHLVPVRVNAEWDQFCELPMGLTVFFFPKDGSEVITVQGHTPYYATARLAVNTYDVLVINDLMDEFGGIKFRGMENLATAEAYAYAIYSQMRMKKATSEPVVAEPERLGMALIRDFEVTQEMLETYWHQRDHGLQIEENVLTVFPENIIYIVDIKVHVSGVQYVRSVEASLSGMAEGYLFDSGRRTTNRVTHLIKDWSPVPTSPTDPDEGYLHATFMSFGLPFGHMAKAAENIMNLTVLLVDNQTVMEFAYQVGNRFREDRWDCSPVLYLEFGKPHIEDPNPGDPDDPDPDDPDNPDDPDDPGFDDPDDPIVFPEVKPEGSMDGGVTIDPGFDGDHSVEIKSVISDKGTGQVKELKK